MPDDPSEFVRRQQAREHGQNAEIARQVLLALLCQPLWITRTVEAVTLVDRHTARRRISRHYVLPAESQLPTIQGTDFARLPVFGIPKGQFLSCDLFDEGGRSVSLPPLPERARLSAAALGELAGDILGELDVHVLERLSRFVTAGPVSCDRELAGAEGDIALAPLFEDQHFGFLATYLTRNYVVYIDVPLSGPSNPPRRLIRFTLDTRFPHTRREVLEVTRLTGRRPGYPSAAWFPKPSVGSGLTRLPRYLTRRAGLSGNPHHHFVPIDGAGSYHLDFEATEGMALGRRRLRFLTPKHGETFDEEHPGASSRRARFLLPRDHGRGEARASIDIRAAPGLLRNGAPVLLLGFAALLFLIHHHYDQLEGKGPALTLLLLLPGLVSFVTARPNEHPYITSVVLWPRLMAITPVPLGIIAAFVLLTKGSSTILLAEAWLSLALGTVLLVGRAIDEWRVKPALQEFCEDDLTRIG